MPQGVDTETPFTSKQWNYINDINGGVYQNSSGLSLVQFDLSSIYNSTQLIDPSSMFMAIPITYVSAYSSGSLVAPTAGSYASTALKSGYFQLLHGCDLQVNGKTLEQFIPNLNSYVSFKMMSQMSQDDLKTMGPSLGMGELIDNWESMIFNGSAISRATGTFPSAVATQGNGNGLTNNLPYPISNVQYSVVCSTIVTAGAATLAQTIVANTAIKAGMLVQGNGISPNTFVANISGTTLTLTGTTANTTTNGITTTGTVSNQYLTFLTPTGADQGDQAISGVQWSGAYNNGLFSRIKRITDVSVATPVAGSSNLYGGSSGSQINCISNSTKLANEFKPYYTILNTNYMVWYDVAIIRMQDVLDSMRAMPMMKKWDGVFRAYLNVGQVVSNISDSGAFSNSITTPCLVSSGSGNTFTNTCPLIHTAIVNTPRTATSIASGLFIGTPTDTAINASGLTINLKNAGASHFLTSCRMYYTQIQLKPEKLDYYISNNRSKKICWTSILNNNFNNIGAGNTFSTLVQSGVSNPRGVLILPFLSTSTGSAITNYGATTTDGTTLASSITTFAQQLSPFDTAPATTSCASLINLQVSVGGVNVLANIISYGYEEFLQQVSIYEKINGGDFGLSCGLINQSFWEHGYRAYYVDLSRANIADLMTPRNINLSFTNNSLQSLDVQVFIEYFREGVVDVETGIVSV
jgi:hypothetical protein